MSQIDREVGDETLIRLAQVLSIVPISESTLMRLVAKKDFPKPIKLGGNISLWTEREVRAWVHAKIENRDKEDLI